VLLAGLALLGLVAFVSVTRTMRAWFERDLALSSELAAAGARQPLLAYWRGGDLAGVTSVLTDLTRANRMWAAALCERDGRLVASSHGYPAELPCSELARRARVDAPRPTSWSDVALVSGLPVHVSAVPVGTGDIVPGVLVLLHDLGFVEARQRQIRTFALAAVALLSLGASLVTLVAARLGWRDWTRELRRLARGESSHRDFQPLLQDVQALVTRMADEQAGEARAGLWTPERLKQTLGRSLHGERVLIVANREPYVDEQLPDGSIETRHPASGLVSALEPVMRACSGVWVAHGSGSADRATSDAKGRLRVPPGEHSYVLRRVWLTPREEQGYYYGFANEGLWPLCHIAHTRPAFRSADWEQYQDVNRQFADAVCDEADVDDPIVLVQDYHFALVPGMIRKRLPRATVLTFWHVPWPNAERFGICPFAAELLQGLLGSSIMGFHTRLHCNNFAESVDRHLEARIDYEHFSISHRGRQTMVRPYPISIEWPNHWLDDVPPAPACRTRVVADLGLPTGVRIGVGVDRIEYTKGIEERLLAVERLLERHQEFVGRFTFVQVGAPSRTHIHEYQALDARVLQLADRINARFAGTRDTWRPVVLRRAHHEPPAVNAYYRAADLCYVSSLHDGMNLVAKEFVAARDDEAGVLVLSAFTGAARELTEALIVNPYDFDEAADAMAAALRMPAAEQRARMRAMRSYLREYNVYRWAGHMLLDAARLRQREQLAGRLTEWRHAASRDVAGVPH
jgi:trehalose 6-phosphate synthase